MKSIESSAKTMEEAVTQGLEKLGVSIGDVTIERLDEGSRGLFGLIGGRPARVRITVKEYDENGDLVTAAQPVEAVEPKQNVAPVKAEAPAKTVKTDKQAAPKAPKAAKPAAKADDAVSTKQEVELCDPATAAGKAQQFLMDVTKLMGVDVSVAARTDEEGNVRVDMHGDTLGILIGRRGETLDSLQYLTSLHVNRGSEDYTRVTLDTENYRAKREDNLTRLANRMASRAVKTGRKVVMEPMNPYERRIMHSALQANENVTTHSEGEEPNRHVVITPKA